MRTSDNLILSYFWSEFSKYNITGKFPGNFETDSCNLRCCQFGKADSLRSSKVGPQAKPTPDLDNFKCALMAEQNSPGPWWAM